MKRIASVAFIILLLASAAPRVGADDRPAMADSSRILAELDALISYPGDFSAKYTISQERPGIGVTVTKATMFRRDRADTYLILITDPREDRGKGYLKIAGNMWLYDPVARRFTVTSVRDRFQGSNARMSDFTQSTLAKDYAIVARSEAQLGAFFTQVYELRAVHSGVSFPLRKIWVDESKLIRKAEDYSLSGQLMRTIAIPSYQRIGSLYVPLSVVIVDALAGQVVNGQFRNERTVISASEPSFAAVPDIVFTQAYLERMSP